ncbi:MAG: YegS/Rv2252/BmrU family lipid kinase [Lachnospiraceae bacterium]|nr:YegS/Rv2252/BmrU family lipid kinase [Lachnospiraceae bacterium]
MKKRLLFIYNPFAGRGLIRQNVSDIIDVFVKAGFDVGVYPTQAQGDAVNYTIDNCEEYDRVVCAGGDGTLDEVVSGIMRAGVKVPIGYIPAGSTNDFGNSLGIDKNILNAAQIAANGKEFAIDIGKFNDLYFVYVAAFGIFTEVSYQTPQEMKNVFGHAAYLLEAVKQLYDIASYKIQVRCAGEVIYGDFIYGMITNAKSVGGIKGIIPGDVSLSDGMFEITLVKKPQNPIELNEIIGFLSGFNNDTNLVYSIQASEIQFTSMENIPWTLDGEYGGSTSNVIIKNEDRAINILVE